MILWYVRLRRAAKTGVYHTSLLEAERISGPCKSVKDPIAAIREADPSSFEPNNTDEESKGDSSFDSEHDKDDDGEEDDEDAYAFMKRQQKELRSSAARRDFFSGIKFQVRTDSI